MPNKHGQGVHPVVPPGVPKSSGGGERLQPQGVQRPSGTAERPAGPRRDSYSYDPNNPAADADRSGRNSGK